jgi:precorrin-8X/cobalt-precorrin-8 methylmutase
MGLNHPILDQSFAVIDRQVGTHGLSPQEYALARRVIHATADFDYLTLLRVGAGAIQAGLKALRKGTPIAADVTMTRQGILGMAAKTFQNPVLTALDFAERAEAGQTRTETGLLNCFAQYPSAVYVFGNAPTALLALCRTIEFLPPQAPRPPLIIGAPVGFISVLEAKASLARLSVPQIAIEGHKGGSPVAAALVNALLVLAYSETSKD